MKNSPEARDADIGGPFSGPPYMGWGHGHSPHLHLGVLPSRKVDQSLLIPRPGQNRKDSCQISFYSPASLVPGLCKLGRYAEDSEGRRGSNEKASGAPPGHLQEAVSRALKLWPHSTSDSQDPHGLILTVTISGSLTRS